VPTFDQLPAEQRAIIELVVQRGRDYDALSDALGITPERVRELARDALVELSPRTAKRIDAERRVELADWVLGQQSKSDAEATRRHLQGSETSRAWANSLLDSLEDMYGDGISVPEVPEPDPSAAAGEERPARKRERGAASVRDRERPRERERTRDRERSRDRERPRREAARPRALPPDAEQAVRNRRIAGWIAGAVVVAGAIILLTGVFSGSDNKTAERVAQPKIVGQLLLQPIQRGGRQQGIAIIAEKGNVRDLIVQAKLDPTKEGEAYEVWLYNSDKDAASVGAQVTDKQGNYQGAGRLPADLRKYRYIDVSLEKIDNNAAHSGQSVLRGALADMRAPQESTPQGGGASGASGATGPGGTP
jgi:anti-sigma-K factor RskA/sigma-70-like protein